MALFKGIKRWTDAYRQKRLIKTLTETNAYGKRIEVLEELGRIGSARAFGAIIDFAKRAERTLRNTAARSLIAIAERANAYGLLFSQLRDSSLASDADIIGCFEQHENKKAALPKLAALLQSKHEARFEVAHILVKSGWTPTEPIEKIWFAIASRDRREIAKYRALAIEPLESILLDDNREIVMKCWVAEELEQLGWKPINQNQLATCLLSRGKWDDLLQMGIVASGPLSKAMRRELTHLHGLEWVFNALPTLVQLDTMQAIDILRNIIGYKKYIEPSGRVERAVELLGAIVNPSNTTSSTISVIANALLGTVDEGKDEGWGGTTFPYFSEVRDACTKALINIGGQETITKVTEIIFKLGNQIGRFNEPFLDERNADTPNTIIGHQRVANSAIHILEEIGSKEAIGALNQALSVKSRTLSEKAHAALQRLNQRAERRELSEQPPETDHQVLLRLLNDDAVSPLTKVGLRSYELDAQQGTLDERDRRYLWALYDRLQRSSRT